MVSNIGGIERAWRSHGEGVTASALHALAKAWPGEVLRYAGTIFPGIVAIAAEDGDDLEIDLLIELLSGRTQAEWRKAINDRRSENLNLKWAAASAEVLSDAWDEHLGEIYAQEAA